MNYRKLGKTDIYTSEIGLGCEGFSVDEYKHIEELLNTAQENGINYFDLFTPDPTVREAVGDLLEGRRDKFYIQAHIGTAWLDGQYQRTRDLEITKRSFEELLRLLKTDYVDVGMIHYVDTEDDWNFIINGPYIEYVKELKKEGKIHYIGLSSHNPRVAKLAVESGLIEVLMFSINPIYDIQPPNDDVYYLFEKENYKSNFTNFDKERQELYESCQNLGIGITVMKAFAGGKLLDSKFSQIGKAMTVNQALHYCLTRPGVDSVLVGAQSKEELLRCIDYEKASNEQKDFSSVLNNLDNINFIGQCMYCGHCAPCPVHIDVASVTKYLDLTDQIVPETVQDHYQHLEHKASECLSCGVCESRCPFGVNVIENMKRASNIFE